jgi:hypothetical protein
MFVNLRALMFLWPCQVKFDIFFKPLILFGKWDKFFEETFRAGEESK